MDTPVLLIVFNRPSLTLKVLDSLREIKPSKIYVSCDGPRENSNDSSLIKEVKEVIAKGIDWDCQKNFLYHEKNLGCGPGPMTAINWFFSHEDRGIILEDDCVPSKSFYQYCTEMLVKYEYDTRVTHINGNNFGAKDHITSDYSYHFVYYHQVWGWATWRRAWSRFTIHLPEESFFFQYKLFRRLGWTYWEYLVQREKWDRVRKTLGKHIWDVQWHYYNYLEGNLAIAPKENLISNIGYGKDATHTLELNETHNIQSKEIKFPLIHPPFIVFDHILNDCYKRNMVKFNWKFFVRRYLKDLTRRFK